MATQSYVDVEGQRLFYREVGSGNSKGNVVLLHGMRFSSKNWEDIATLAQLAGAGYRAVAVDLPGYGNSAEAQKPQSRSGFLVQLFKQLNIDRPIIISPSMSGEYSLPLIHERGELIRAYIPIAPVNTEKYSAELYRKISIPTFIVYGENDTMLGDVSLNNLKNIPGSKVMKMEKAGHACYLDQPQMWHDYLKEILILLST